MRKCVESCVTGPLFYMPLTISKSQLWSYMTLLNIWIFWIFLDISGYFWMFECSLPLDFTKASALQFRLCTRLTAPLHLIAPMEICSWRPLSKGMGSHSKASEESFFKSFLLIVKENPESFEAFVGQRRRECFPEVAMVAAQEVTVNVFATSPSRKCHRYMVKL